MKLAISG